MASRSVEYSTEIPREFSLRYAQGRKWDAEQKEFGEIAAVEAAENGLNVMLSKSARQYAVCADENRQLEAPFRTDTVEIAGSRYYLDGVLVAPYTSGANQPRRLPRAGRHLKSFDIRHVVGENPQPYDPKIYGFRFHPSFTSLPPQFTVGGEDYPGPTLGAPNEIFAAKTLIAEIRGGLIKKR